MKHNTIHKPSHCHRIWPLFLFLPYPKILCTDFLGTYVSTLESFMDERFYTTILCTYRGFCAMAVIEKYTKKTRFCLICNYVSKIIPALQSRCTRFRFAPLDAANVSERLHHVIQQERYEFETSCGSMLKTLFCEPDIVLISTS